MVHPHPPLRGDLPPQGGGGKRDGGHPLVGEMSQSDREGNTLKTKNCMRIAA